MSKYKRSGRAAVHRAASGPPVLAWRPWRAAWSFDRGGRHGLQRISTSPARCPAHAPGLANRTVFVDLHNDGVQHSDDPSAVTDASGHYVITGVNPGTLRVLTYPGDNPTTPTAVATNSNSSTANFGLQPESTVLPTVPQPRSRRWRRGTPSSRACTATSSGGTPTRPGPASWDAAASRRARAPTQVAGQFLQSPEYHDPCGRVLLRDPSRPRRRSGRGSHPWAAKLQAVRARSRSRQRSSPRPSTDPKHVTDGDFVQSLDQNILGRAGDPAGMNNWTQLLGTGTSRGAVAASFIGSPESSRGRSTAITTPSSPASATPPGSTPGWPRSRMGR